MKFLPLLSLVAITAFCMGNEEHTTCIEDEKQILSLEEAEAISLENNKDVQRTFEIFQRELYAKRSAIGQLLPSVQLSGSSQRFYPQNEGGEYDSSSLSAQFNQAIFSMPLYTAVSIAGWAKDQRFWEYIEAKNNSLAEVRRTYYRLIAIKNLIQIQQRNLDLLKESYENEGFKLEYGDSTALNYNRNKLEYTTELSTYYGFVRDYELTFEQWLGALGVDPECKATYRVLEDDINLEDNLFIRSLLSRINSSDLQIVDRLINNEEYTYWNQIACRCRPVIKTAEADVGRKKAQVRSAQADYFPVVNGFARKTYVSFAEEERFGSAFDGWELGVNVSWNLFDSLAREHRVASANRDHRAACVTEKNQRNAVYLSILDEGARIESAIYSYLAAKEGRNLAEESLKHAMESVELGSISALEYRDVIRSLTRANITYEQSKLVVISSYYTLLETIGLCDAEPEMLCENETIAYERETYQSDWK